MRPEIAQVYPDSQFGQRLMELANPSEVIVDVGCWSGMGTTLSLFLGSSHGSHIYAVEADTSRALTATMLWRFQEVERRISIVRGTVCLPGDFSEFHHPDPGHRKYYDAERELTLGAKFVAGDLPGSIDLLVLDGGEWSGRGDFLSLYKRAKVIAMDDTNPEKSVKNYANRAQLISEGWVVVNDLPNDRNGWFIARRP